MQRFARGLRRLRSHYTHTPADFTKRICFTRVSKVSYRGHSVAASVVSDDTKVKKAGKKVPRVPRDERMVMVESYVVKYKETNNGKCPSPSDTRKQVGGSYYVIKNILQELEHRSKAPPMSTTHESELRKEANDSAVITKIHLKKKTLSEKVVKPNETVDADDVNSAYSDVKSADKEGEPKESILLNTEFSDEFVKPKKTKDGYEAENGYSNFKGVSVEEEIKDSTLLNTDFSDEFLKPEKTIDCYEAENGYSNFKAVFVEEEIKDSTLLRKTLHEEVVKPKTTDDGSTFIGKQKHELKVESEEVVVHLHYEERVHDMKEKLTSDSHHIHRQQDKPSPESDKYAKGNSEKQTKHEELPEQKSIWGNLRSLASGIMKIWRGS